MIPVWCLLYALLPWESNARPSPLIHLSAWLPTPTRAAAKRTMRCVLRNARHWRQANWGGGGRGVGGTGGGG